jgi:hypothetical protein
LRAKLVGGKSAILVSLKRYSGNGSKFHHPAAEVWETAITKSRRELPFAARKYSR